MMVLGNFNIWLLLFTLSSSSAILVNKYVLWVLRFTYPTAFQSWQMFVAAFLLYSLHNLGYIQLDSFSKPLLKSWFPAIVFFTINIYSGSVALANLPVPIFCLAQQKLFHCGIQVIHIWKSRKMSLFYLFTVCESAICVAFLLFLEDNFSVMGYKWLGVHALSVFAYTFYVNCLLSKQIKEIDKVVLNATFSVLLLQIVGVLSGETNLIFQFEHLYRKHFHIAVMGSGLCGTVIMVSYSKLCTQIGVQKVRFCNVFILLFVSLISLLVFQTTLSFSQLNVVIVGFVGMIGEMYYQHSYISNADDASKVDKGVVTHL